MQLARKTRSSPDKTLVLDLDETLIHSSIDPTMPHQHTINMKVNDTEAKVFFLQLIFIQVYISFRPWVSQFLKEVSKIFEVVIFTASEVRNKLIIA